MIREAYRGYLIVETIHGFFISRDGTHIGSDTTFAGAKAQIDLIS